MQSENENRLAYIQVLLYVKIIKKLKERGKREKKFLYLYTGINKLKKFWGN